MIAVHNSLIFVGAEFCTWIELSSVWSMLNWIHVWQKWWLYHSECSSNKFWPTLDKTIKEQELRSQNYAALSFQNNPSLVNCYRAVQHKSLVSDMFRWIKLCHMNPSHTIKEPTSAYMVPYWQLVFISSSSYQSPAVNPKQLELWFIWLHHELAVLQCPISNR